MSEADEKQTLQRFLQYARGALLWKPDGRHAGHADIIRESIDDAAGLREGVSGLPPEAGAAAWKQDYDKLEGIARSARSHN